MTWRQRRAARLRARADRLDPGGEMVRLMHEDTEVSITYETCCEIHILNGRDIGAPLFYRFSDRMRLSETTAEPVTDHH